MVIVVLRPSCEGKIRSNTDLTHRGEVDLRLVEAKPDAGPGLLNETGAAGIYVSGGGSTNSLNGFPNKELVGHWTKGHRAILAQSLDLDMPVLAVGQGLFLLNEVFGGKSPEVLSIEGVHSADSEKPGRRTIYVSPGSKAAVILGAGGFFRLGGEVPSSRLMDRHRAPRLLASAYDVEDGAVEGLESAEHDWVIGFRADLSRDKKLPRGFSGIYQAFLERAEVFSLARTVP